MNLNDEGSDEGSAAFVFQVGDAEPAHPSIILLKNRFRNMSADPVVPPAAIAATFGHIPVPVQSGIAAATVAVERERHCGRWIVTLHIGVQHGEGTDPVPTETVDEMGA